MAVVAALAQVMAEPDVAMAAAVVAAEVVAVGKVVAAYVVVVVAEVEQELAEVPVANTSAVVAMAAVQAMVLAEELDDHRRSSMVPGNCSHWHRHSDAKHHRKRWQLMPIQLKTISRGTKQNM